MNWRAWVYGKLTTLTTVPATSVFAAGDLTGSPSARPFVIFRVQETTPRLRDGGSAVRVSKRMEVWAYDNPGTYQLVDAILTECQSVLVGPIAQPGAVCCEWDGDGSELFDDDFKALTRVGGYQLIGAA